MPLPGFTIRLVPATLMGFALAASAASPQAFPPDQGRVDGQPDLLFAQAAQVRAGGLNARFPAGSRIVRLMKG